MSPWAAALVLTVACSVPEDGLLAVDGAAPDVTPPAPDSGADVTDATTPDAISDDVTPMPDVVTNDAPVVTAGDALAFTNGSYVDMGVLPIPADFTLEAWIDPASESGETYVVAEDKRSQGAGQFRFGLADKGKLFFVMSDAGGSTHQLYSGAYALESASAIAVGVWTHVAVVKNGAVFMLTVNGVAAASVTADAAFVYPPPMVPFRVAARVDTNGSAANGAFDGIIDEVRLWNQPRTASQIAQTMSTTVPPTTSGLVGYWRFDDGSGTSALDQVSAHPGTLVANPTWVTSTAF